MSQFYFSEGDVFGEDFDGTVEISVITYHLFDTRWSKLIHYLGLGAYHSGLSINGRELSYGHCEVGSGVYVHDDYKIGEYNHLECHAKTYVETVKMSKEDVIQIINDTVVNYNGDEYEFLSHNCHNFVDDLCGRLCGKNIPGWVSRVCRVVNFVPGLRSVVMKLFDN